ncbi:M56 family metallopeptidase [Nibrella saemangeumensis]|uniref:M56 family metallopeptidase n=1 Tax=Nibrella saemangeumensis TaxID=1084526 RepID=A0ABP8N2F3_9BACT
MTIIDYFLRANLFLLLFYACYWLGLRRHTFFQLNRWYLLASIGLSLVLPWITVPAQTVEALRVPVTAVSLPSITVTQRVQAAGPDWQTILFALYGLVAMGLLIRLGVQVIRLLRLIRRSAQQPQEDYTLVTPEVAQAPTFSFFRYLVLNPADTHSELIRRHELVHIRQRHSADVLLIEIVQAFFWINPVVTLYKQAIQQVHEYLADQQAADKDQYAMFLVDYAFGVHPVGLTNSFFNSSQLKQRIVMLKSRTTSRWALIRYALVIPAAALLVMCTQKEADVAKLVERKSDDKATAGGLSALSRIGLKGEVFTVVEDQPQFPGGMAELGAYLGKNIRYPETAVQAGTQGKVFVSFVIAADGSTHDVNVLKGVSKELDAEAMRVVYDMPRWQPGRQDGKAVNVRYNLPISFQLGDGPNGEKLVPPPPPPAEAPLAPPPPPVPPLYILDGKELPKGTDIKDKLDPNTIKSIDVLKGDKAKAIYGEKGQDGVIIITTKK